MKKWKCSVCGYVHSGDSAPGSCPVCGADKSKFAETTESTKSLQENIDAQIQGEAWEVVHYIGAALLAEKLGFACAGQIIRHIADEEAYHGANYVFRSGADGTTKEALKEFIGKMIEAERGAHKMKSEGASLALAEGKDEIAAFFKITAEDEARHAVIWEKALKSIG